MVTILQWANTASAIFKWGTFSPSFSIVILFSLLPRNFVVESLRYPVLILNTIPFSIFFTYIFLTGGSSVSVSYFLMIYSKWSWITDTEYDPSGNSKLSFLVGDDILNPFFIGVFMFYHV